jgi:parallel beta-helix repeat protein
MAIQKVYLLNQNTPVNIPSGLVPKGAYAAGTDYAVGDSVDYLGSSYVMFVDAAAGTLPTDTTKWQVMANKGETGTPGTDGADSIVPGPAGADGVVQTVVAGTNITVDATDPANPIVNADIQGRTATFVVAASDATAVEKSQADYVCDGTADDVQLNAAITALPVGGGKIVLTEGTFNVVTSVIFKSNVTFMGQGYGTLISMASTTTNEPILNVYALTGTYENVVIENLRIQGAGSGNHATAGDQRGIHSRNTSNIRIRNVWVYETPSTGITLDQSTNAIAENCFIQNTGYNCIGIGENLVTNVLVKNCWLTGASNAGIEFNSVVSGGKMIGCYSYANKWGCRIAMDYGSYAPTGISLVGNTFRDNTQFGVIVTNGIDIIIDSNTVQNNLAGNYDGIKLDTTTKSKVANNISSGNGGSGILIHKSPDNVINSNICYNNGQQSTTADGIKFTDSLSIYSLRNVVIGNKCFDDQATKTQRYGINLTSGTDYLVIIGNDVQNNKTGNLNVVGTNNKIMNNIGDTTNTDIGVVIAAALGADDNYVTDAEKVIIGNTSGINTGDRTLVCVVSLNHGAVAWTDQPATLTEVFGNTNRRTKVDMSGFLQCRVSVAVTAAGVAGSHLKVQYSTDLSTWVDLTSTTLIDATGVNVSTWENIPAGGKADVYLRAAGIDGNGTADPSLGTIQLQLK